MPLPPTERDRLLLFTAAELARTRLGRGLRLNVPEATALIADTVCEAARDGLRLADALERGRAVLGPADVLPGVTDVVTEIQVEAVFDDGTRLAVISAPFGDVEHDAAAPGAVLPHRDALPEPEPAVTVEVRNTADVPVSVTSHFHYFEANPRLDFDRAAAYGMRPTQRSLRAGRRPAHRAPGVRHRPRPAGGGPGPARRLRARRPGGVGRAGVRRRVPGRVRQDGP
ncbi:urease subunit gamma [Streptomyces xanthii]|nr:urease subunit gamma [Streptomyces xanthii]